MGPGRSSLARARLGINDGMGAAARNGKKQMERDPWHSLPILPEMLLLVENPSGPSPGIVSAGRQGEWGVKWLRHAEAGTARLDATSKAFMRNGARMNKSMVFSSSVFGASAAAAILTAAGSGPGRRPRESLVLRTCQSSALRALGTEAAPGCLGRRRRVGCLGVSRYLSGSAQMSRLFAVARRHTFTVHGRPADVDRLIYSGDAQQVDSLRFPSSLFHPRSAARWSIAEGVPWLQELTQFILHVQSCHDKEMVFSRTRRREDMGL